MVGLVSMASGDLRPVPKVVVKWSRKLGRSGFNKQGIGKHMQMSEKCKHSPRTLLVYSSERCPDFPSACYVCCKNVERGAFDKRLERGLGLEEDLVGVASDRMS